MITAHKRQLKVSFFSNKLYFKWLRKIKGKPQNHTFFNKEDKNAGEWQKVDLNTHRTDSVYYYYYFHFLCKHKNNWIFIYILKKSWRTICSNLVFNYSPSILFHLSGSGSKWTLRDSAADSMFWRSILFALSTSVSPYI